METPISRRSIFEGRIFSVRVDTVSTQKGCETTREIIDKPDTVSVVAIDDEHNILLVKQYRYAVGKCILEIPAGSVDPGETPEEAARRELREETGYDCKTLTPIYTFWPAVGYCTEKMIIFVGTGLKLSPLKGDEGYIEVLRLPFNQVHQSVQSGQPVFEDAKSSLGVLLAAKLFD